MNKKKLLLEETLFSTANGYLGVRGNLEEGVPENYSSIRGVYLNGVYGYVPIEYGENCYGFPQRGETIINLFDAQGITLKIDDDLFSIFSGIVHSSERCLDIEKGVSKRRIDWSSPKGHHLIIEITRMTSFDIKELFVIDYRVTSINYTGPIEIFSTVEGDVKNFSDENDPRVASHEKKHLYLSQITADPIMLQGHVHETDIMVTLKVKHEPSLSCRVVDDKVIGHLTHRIEESQSFQLLKYCVYTDSRQSYCPDINDIVEQGIESLYQRQIDDLNEFWSVAKISVDGEASVEEGLNYNSYQLLASAGKDGLSNIAAKGLSGEGYEGHYFWDTEIYMLPLFSMTCPKVARELLYYRYQTLKDGYKEGRALGHDAPKVPWRTISGVESSPYYPAGSAQYHINADVAYAFIQYYLLTGDDEMMRDFGFTYLYETAKLWIEVGHEYKGMYMIHGVTGPDEYTALVNNNYYTNAMAKYHLEWVVKLSKKFDVSLPLLTKMQKIAEMMYLPYDKELNIHLQDDACLSRKPWNFEASRDKHPLLLYYHPLYIYRHQVLKQADTVLAHFLLDEKDEEIMRHSYEYYEAITTHDSSLSYCVYGMMATRLGYIEEGYEYFKKSIRLDLDDLHGNTKDGLHVANAGGAYMFVPFGFGGLRIKETLILNPVLPKAWKGYSFKFLYKNQIITVSVSDVVKVSCNNLRITIYDEQYYVTDQIIIKTK